MTALLLTTVLAAHGGPALSAAEVQKRLGREGAETVLEELLADERLWGELLDRIATAAEPWLDVAEALRDVRDAEASHDLDLALGEALVADPGAVLSRTGDVFDVGDVCGNYGLIEETEEDTYDAALRAIEERVAAVSRVRRRDLRAAQRECLDELGELKRDVERLFGADGPVT